MTGPTRRLIEEEQAGESDKKFVMQLRMQTFESFRMLFRV
jgi:hypothetical protein